MLPALLAACGGPAIETPEQALAAAQEALLAHRTMTYDAAYTIKFFDNEPGDTTRVWAHVKLLRDTTDTIFGGRLWFATRDSLVRYYDGDLIHVIDTLRGRATTYQAHAGQEWGLTGNVAADVIRSYFLRPQRLGDMTQDSTVTLTMADATLNGRHCWAVTALLADEEDFHDGSKTLWIDKRDRLIRRIEYRMGFQDRQQHNAWAFSNIRFDDLDATAVDAEARHAMRDLVVEAYRERDPAENLPLALGTAAPALRGELMPGASPFDLAADRKGRVTVLDFWYMACHPCIKAVPHLVELRGRYPEADLLVLGVDRVDNTPQKRERLPAFMTTNRMNYPTLLVDNGTDSLYRVRGYPTLYVLDKEGRVAFAQVGYNEQLTDTLGKVLDKALGR